MTLQLIIEKFVRGGTELMKAAGMKALELSGGYKSIRSIARFRTASPTGKDTVMVRAFAISRSLLYVALVACAILNS